MAKKENYMDIGKYRKNINYIQIWRQRGLIIGIILSIIFIIVQIFCMMSEYEKEKGIRIWSAFETWYEFEPNSLFASEALRRYDSAATSVMLKNEAKVYTEYLAKWAGEPDVDVLRLKLKGIYGNEDIRIYSYLNQKSYAMAWEAFSLPLAEGRWFEGTADEVICIQGKNYEIGDVIKVNEEDGDFYFVTVVGKSSYPYLPNNILPVKSGVHNSLYTPADDLDIFLLNPLSVRNEKSDLISYNTTLIKTDNEYFVRENSKYGAFTSVDQSLKNDKVNYVVPAIEMCLGILFLVLFSGINIHMKEDTWMLLWIWLGGILGGFIGAIFYFDAKYKVFIVFALCSILSLSWWFIHKCTERKTTVNETEMEVVLLQKDEEWDKTEI